MTRVAAIGIAFAALAAAAPASARAGADRPGRALFEQAETKFNLGRFDEALTDYQAAYEVEPLPAFLFNIGQCYRNLGNYERAQFFFRRYTALDPRSPNRPAAERLIAEMDKLVGAQASQGEHADGAAWPASSAPGLNASAAAAGGDAPAAQPAAALARPGGDRAPSAPVYRRAWFWVAVAAVVVGGVAAGFAIARDDPQSSLRPIDTR